MSTHKIIVVGCGSMANTWIDYAIERSNAEIVALVDVFEENAKAKAEQKGLLVPIYSDLQEALEKTEANLVFDVTIPSSHKEVVTTALRAGCNVFGEKPMAESMQDAIEVEQVAQVTGNRYSVMQNRRYLRNIRAVHSALKNESIGQVGSIHADFFLGPHFGGFRDAMDHPLIIDMAIHTFDQGRFISGADPVSVYCHEYNPPGSWYEGNASAICIFEMSDGTVFTYRGSWCAEGFNTSWESEWRITGSEGTLKWNGASAPKCEVVDREKPTNFMNQTVQVDVQVDWDGQEGHFGCLDEMFRALEENRPAETDAADNIFSMAMVFGAVESAKTGKKVLISDLLEK